MIRKFTVLMLLLALMLSGCASKPPVTKAGLTVLASDEVKKWDIPDKLKQQGEGNSYRVLSSPLGQEQKMLELVAGSDGYLEYFIEQQADITATAQIRLQFLSTQGSGRIKFSALDSFGNVIGETGFVYTGQMPKPSVASNWQDVRYTANYQGDWLEQTYNLSEMLSALPAEILARTEKYRLSVEVGQGQHAMISQFAVGTDKNKAVRVMPSSAKYTAQLGEMLSVEADIENASRQPMDNVVVKLLEPYGYGVVTNQASAAIDHLAPGEKRRVNWQIQAKRSNGVNLNKPWIVKFNVNEIESQAKIEVSVTDMRPGKIFYVMTEDLEPIDGAGYAKAWGNANSWLEPQEFFGQMVVKSEKLNTIADKYGAKWTHYIAWPAVKAAEWAAEQSRTGEWPKVVSAINQSVVEGTGQGHEYGIHLHSDYDPYLPGNILSYNEAVDGLWANHLKHGWAHSVTVEGDFSDHASRSGMLYDYQRILDKLASDSPQGQILTARLGSFDFGNGSADEAMSTRVYNKVGLWGSSDADGNAGGLTTGEYGREIYFAAPDDINTTARDITNMGIVEFRPTPRESIAYDSQSANIMNGKTDQGMKFFTNEVAGVKPGIHAIIGFTHAMFIMGQDGWQSTDGGQFQVFDDHLAYVKQQYVDKGMLNFGTASELVQDYLDYYSPQLMALYGKRISEQNGASEYTIRILGKDIMVDESHVHTVNIKYPLYLRDSAYRISVLKNGQPIYSTWGLPTPFNDIRFVVDDKEASYTLKIYHNELIYQAMAQIHSIKAKIYKKIN